MTARTVAELRQLADAAWAAGDKEHAARLHDRAHALNRRKCVEEGHAPPIEVRNGDVPAYRLCPRCLRKV